jgi:transcriptional regulator
MPGTSSTAGSIKEKAVLDGSCFVNYSLTKNILRERIGGRLFSPELKKGSIELIILTILKERSHHGYEIGKLIEIRSQGRLQFRITSLYPVLYRMENRRWITSRWVEKAGEQRRNYYSITPQGRRVLVDELERWRDFTEAVNLIVGADHA